MFGKETGIAAKIKVAHIISGSALWQNCREGTITQNHITDDFVHCHQPKAGVLSKVSFTNIVL